MRLPYVAGEDLPYPAGVANPIRRFIAPDGEAATDSGPSCGCRTSPEKISLIRPASPGRPPR